MQFPGFADWRLQQRLVLAWRVKPLGLGLILRWVHGRQTTAVGKDAARLALSLLSQLTPWLRISSRHVLQLTFPRFSVSTCFDFGTRPVWWLRNLPRGVGSILRFYCAALLDSERTLSSTCTTWLLYIEGGTLLSSMGLSLVCDEHSIRGAGLAEGVNRAWSQNRHFNIFL